MSFYIKRHCYGLIRKTKTKGEIEILSILQLSIIYSYPKSARLRYLTMALFILSICYEYILMSILKPGTQCFK